LQIYHFFRFPVWAPLTNLLLLPLGGLVISALFGAACAGLVLPQAFTLAAPMVDASLCALAWVAQLLARLPLSLVATGKPSLVATMGAMVLVGCLSIARRASGRDPRRTAAGIAVILALLCLQPVWLHRPRPELAVSFFAVGQGDAALVRCGRQAVLVDFGPPGPPGGGSSRFARSVLPYLQATRTFPSLGILSHPHADHIGGLSDAMHQFPAMRVLTRDCFRKATLDWVQAGEPVPHDRLLWVDREGTLALPAATSVRGVSQLMVELLWAPGLGPDVHVNELSCALRVWRQETGAGPGDPLGAPAGAVLFAGDLGRQAEDVLVAAKAALLRASVLKVGHHGSGGSTTWGFLRIVKPELAVISVGQNGFGHPAPECLDRLASSGAMVLRTDRSGWTGLVVSGGKMIVTTYR
jgi:competence protein ComEC